MKRNTTTNNKNGVFRPKRVSNTALRDPNLSLKAKGLYSLIQSYITLPDFTLYKNHLMSLCLEGTKAFNSAWREIKEKGYLKQYRIPGGENDTFIYEYELLDEPDLSTPGLINLNKNREEIKKENSLLH